MAYAPTMDTFEDWLRYQQIDLRGKPDSVVASLRDAYMQVAAQTAEARSMVLFSMPTAPGEYRHAIATKESTDLRLALVVKRSPRGEFFILYPRGEKWGDPHSSYHGDGRYHQKSYDQKFSPGSRRQPLDANFKGSEHLGSFHGVFGIGLPVCDSSTSLP